jgi:hypothetical protein
MIAAAAVLRIQKDCGRSMLPSASVPVILKFLARLVPAQHAISSCSILSCWLPAAAGLTIQDQQIDPRGSVGDTSAQRNLSAGRSNRNAPVRPSSKRFPGPSPGNQSETQIVAIISSCSGDLATSKSVKPSLKKKDQSHLLVGCVDTRYPPSSSRSAGIKEQRTIAGQFSSAFRRVPRS